MSRLRRLSTAAFAAAAVAAATAPAPAAAAVECPDAPIRPTLEANYPAGCSVYELVSPPDKGVGEVGNAGWNNYHSTRLSPSGDHALYVMNSAVLGSDGFFNGNSYYSSRTGSSWNRASVVAMLPFVSVLGGVDPQTMSANGRWTFRASNVDPETGATTEVRGYAVDLLSGTPYRVTPPAVGGGDLGLGGTDAVIVGDNERIVAAVTSPLTPSASTLSPGTSLVYSFEGGQATQVSTLPNGDASSGYFADHEPAPRSMRRWGVANDGRTVWWTPAMNGTLYRGSVSGTPSVAVNASENTATSVPLEGATPIGASADGRRMAFVSSQKLTTGTDALPAGQRVYLYTHSSNPATDQNLTLVSTAGEPADTTPLEIAGNAQISANGQTIYFWTTGKQLVAGGPIGSAPKLYRWKNGQLTYLLSASLDAPTSYKMLSVASDNGEFYAFDSPTELTAKPTGGVHQRYLYDARSGDVDCASCGDSGAASAVKGPESVTTPTLGLEQRRFLSTDGQLIVETATALVPEDTNGVQDVYAWKDGHARLISTGMSATDSRFADASLDGSSVGLVTVEKLSAWDVDDRNDFYVARPDGGVAEPQARVVDDCAGDGCQGPAGPAVAASPPATATYVGPGDLAFVPEADAPAPPAKAKVVKRKTVRGTATTLRVTVPDRGSVRVSGRGLRQATKTAKGKQTLAVPVRLSAASKRTLGRKGSWSVLASVRYAPAGGKAQTLRVRVTFKKAKTSSSRGVVAKGGR